MYNVLNYPNNIKKYIHPINLIFLFFLLLINFKSIYTEDIECKSNNNLNNNKCFNNIIKFDHQKFRAGHFSTTNNNDLIIEYSTDDPATLRMFYGLTKDGRYFFPNESHILEFNIIGAKYNDATTYYGRYESRNLFINLKDQTNTENQNQYLFSVSSFQSVVELHDLHNNYNDTYYTWTAKNFFNLGEYEIFSFEFSLFEIKDNIYIIAFTANKHGENKGESFILKKFQFNSFNENGFEQLKSFTKANNYNNRIISAFSMDDNEMLVVFHVENTTNVEGKQYGKYAIRLYDYELEEKNVTYPTNDLKELFHGDGIFFKSLYLNNSYSSFLYFTDKTNGKSLSLNIYKYSRNNNDYQMNKVFDSAIDSITFYLYELLGDFLKIDEKRAVFFGPEGDDKSTRYLHILLFDFYDNYSKMKLRKYSYNINDYIIKKEMSGYIYNNYLLFDMTTILKLNTMTDDSWKNFFSTFIIFGYANGTDSTIDISYLFINADNYNSSINFTSLLNSNITIDNNIFGYIPDDKILLISIPDEIILYKENENIKIENNTYLNISDKYILKQNINITKTYEYYYLDYQYIIREPDFDDLYGNAHEVINYTDNTGYNYQGEYVPKVFYGRTNRLMFKLCHDYCETCNEISIDNDNQKCLSCLPLYQYDYWYYKDEIKQGNCVPEGYFNDIENKSLILCNTTEYKYYYNSSDNKLICFKNTYDCPDDFPTLNETTNECLNISLPTTIMTTIPTTIITTIPTTIITTIPTTIITTIPTTIMTTILTTIPTTIITTIPTTIMTTILTTIPTTIITTIPTTIMTTIPTTIVTTIPTTIIQTQASDCMALYSSCTYFNLIQDLCNFDSCTDEEIYQIIKQDVINSYPKGGGSIVVNTNDNYTMEITTVKDQLDVLNGNKSSNLSVIDFKECADLLVEEYGLDSAEDLIILKYENITKNGNEKSVQYEVYAINSTIKLNLSICSSTKIDIYIPIELSEETQKLYDNMKEQGYNLFDKNDKFYTDICTPYESESGTDIPLSDRNNDLYNKNQLTCQANCEYSDYSSQSKYLKCECDVVNEDKIETQNPEKITMKSIFKSFFNVLKYSNYKVLTCHNLVFRDVTFTKNIGSILAFIYFLGYLASFILFCYKRFFYLINEIKKLFNKRKKHDIRNYRPNKTSSYVNDLLIFNRKNIINTENITNKMKLNDYNKSEGKIVIRNIESNILNGLNDDNDENKDSKKSNIIGDYPPKKNADFSTKIQSKTVIENDKNVKKDVEENKNVESNELLNNKMSVIDSQQTLRAINSKSSEEKNEKVNKTVKFAVKAPIFESKIDLKEIGILSDYEYNNLEYIIALELDKRSFFRVYWSLLKREHTIIFTFFAWNDYNIFSIKLSKFFFLLCTDMALNVFFFSDDSMHNLYVSEGSFDFFDQIVQMIYSTIVSQILGIFLNYLTMTDILYYDIKRLKKDAINKSKVLSIINCIKYKIIGFYIFTFILFFFYWYTIAAFCAVYENTQIIFIIDSILSFILGLLYPFAIYFIPTGLRFLSLRAKEKKNLKIVYKLSDIIPFF